MRASIFIVGEAKGMPRTRATSRRGGGVPGPAHAYMYTPTTANGWRYPVTLALAKLASEIGMPVARACRIDCTFYFERPKAHWVGGDYKRIRPTAPVYHESKPDRDNLDKLLLDAAVAASLLTDDRIVCLGEIQKRYATREPPGCLITLETDIGPLTVGELYSEELLNLAVHPRVAPGTVYATQVGNPSMAMTG